MTLDFDPFAYVDAAAAALDLPIPPEHRDAVAANIVRLHALARQLLSAELPDGSDEGVTTAP